MPEAAQNAHTELPVHVFRLVRATLEPHDTHAHVGHVLTFVWGGEITMEHGTRLHIAAGSVAVVPAGTPHRLLGGVDVTLTGVSFCSSCLQLFESDPLMQAFRMVRRGGFPGIALDPSRRDRIERLLSYLEEELQAPSRHSHELSRALIRLVLGEVDRSLSLFDQDGSASDGLVTSALRYIEEHSREAISLVDVASTVGRTSSHVAKCVKRATGYTVGQWISTRRVTEAAALLAHTDLNLDTITEHVGWADTTHLIRQFKRYYGETPAAWRRAHVSRA